MTAPPDPQETTSPTTPERRSVGSTGRTARRTRPRRSPPAPTDDDALDLTDNATRTRSASAPDSAAAPETTAASPEATAHPAEPGAVARPTATVGESPVTGAARVLGRVTTVLGPTALLTAVGYYFGWLRTNAAASEAGLDPSLFGFGTSDYILRSADALIRPFGFVVLVAAALVFIDALVLHALAAEPEHRARRVRRVATATGLVGTVVLVIGVARLPDYLTETPAFTAPVLTITGAVLLVFTVLLPFRTDVGGWFYAQPAATLVAGFLAVLAVGGLLLAVARYAELEGRGAVNRFVVGIAEGVEPHVTVVSPEPLDLPGARYGRDEVEGTVLHRYSCLHLLVRANDRFFLVNPTFGLRLTDATTGESDVRAVAMVVRDEPGLRVFFDSSVRRGGVDPCPAADFA